MQFGFRKNHSTKTANSFFVEKIKFMLSKNSYVGAVFLDLKKAFDTVNHNILLNKLTQFNFSPDSLKWFQSYLLNRKQCVCINEVHSQCLSNDVVVPQGSILGPLLFSLYINNLPDVCPELDVLMYADDAVLFTYGSNIKTVASNLTEGLSKVHDWLQQS